MRCHPTKEQGQRTNDAEHGIPLPTISNGFVDHTVLLRDLLFTGLYHGHHALIQIALIHLSEALVKHDFGRKQLELEADLFIIARGG